VSPVGHWEKGEFLRKERGEWLFSGLKFIFFIGRCLELQKKRVIWGSLLALPPLLAMPF
jgi:hypothetical protein